MHAGDQGLEEGPEAERKDVVKDKCLARRAAAEGEGGASKRNPSEVACLGLRPKCCG